MILDAVDAASENDHVLKTVTCALKSKQGLVKTKALLREKMCFPGMDEVVERKTKSCLSWAIGSPSTTREPLIMTPLPRGQFQEISIDFATVQDATLLVGVGNHSHHPFIETESSNISCRNNTKIRLFVFYVQNPKGCKIRQWTSHSE